MTQLSAGQSPDYGNEVGVSLLALGGVLLRRRRMIIALAIAGAGAGLATGLLMPRRYTSSATFIPEGAGGQEINGIAAAATQFGFRIPVGQNDGSWGPAVYVSLVHSRTLLQPIAADTFLVRERGPQRIALLDLLDVRKDATPVRLNFGVQKLRTIITVAEDKALGAVTVSVSTKWPSLSFALEQRLIESINQFNLEKRKSQASAEYQFVQTQAAEAERDLRQTEVRLQQLLQSNRVIGSTSELAMERDRLQRDVELHQQVYTALVLQREQARVGRVRDTPVITMLEEPEVPAVGEPRKSVQKAIFGALIGILVGALLALLSHRLAGAKQAPSEEARAFFELVDEATPRLLRRGRGNIP
jgi:uncharacterized protein involved in exopolysaccharide biosynthesis